MAKKREKPVENLTFIAIMTAITVAFFAILTRLSFGIAAKPVPPYFSIVSL